MTRACTVLVVLSVACARGRAPSGTPEVPADTGTEERLPDAAFLAPPSHEADSESLDPSTTTGLPIGAEQGPYSGEVHGLLTSLGWEDREVALGEGAGKYRIIVLQDYMFKLLPAVREANPDAVVLAYQKAGGMRADGGSRPSTGVQTHEAEDGHEDWFLHDEDGNRLIYCDFSVVSAANIGSESFQERWLSNVAERVVADGFDGVYLDDTNLFPGHCMGSDGTAIAEYPTDEEYGDAMVEFILAVGPGLQEAGLLVVPNVAMNPWEDVHRSQSMAMMPAITHFFREFWMRWRDSANFTDDNWDSTFELMVDVQAEGVGFLGITYGPGDEGEVAGQRYGAASWLMAWDGESDSAWGYIGDDPDPWGPDWVPAIGRPLEDPVAVGVGWMRRYNRGIAVVNPDSKASQDFELGGEYADPDGDLRGSLTLRPGEGLVLTVP